MAVQNAKGLKGFTTHSEYDISIFLNELQRWVRSPIGYPKIKCHGINSVAEEDKVIDS